ncbi:hypothetical protein BC628DRAFT_336230 [Trametes gibbosa]|nr:hypothetical protein BC628DRAFT_336230 [Trametes gibbosa]
MITVHFRLRLWKCGYTWFENGRQNRCQAVYAQDSTLTAHIKHKHAGWGPLPCKAATCEHTFHDASSRSRHFNEQHRGKTYECPIPTCLDRTGQRKHIKRASEFKKHLRVVHGREEDEVEKYVVPARKKVGDPPVGQKVEEGPVGQKVEEGPVVQEVKERDRDSGQQKQAARSTRSSQRRAQIIPQDAAPPPYSCESEALSTIDLPPSYSETLHTTQAAHIPTICTPDDDGQASTPGLSFFSPSPSPSVPEITYNNYAQAFVAAPCYDDSKNGVTGTLNSGPQHEHNMTRTTHHGSAESWNIPTHGDMASLFVGTAATSGMLPSESDLYDPSYDSNFDMVTYGNVLWHAANMHYAPAQKDATYDPFAHIPYSSFNFSEPQWLPPPLLTEYEHLDSTSSWDMPILDPLYVNQPSPIVLPSLPQFMPPPYDMYHLPQ